MAGTPIKMNSMYKASIVSTKISKGLLSVEVSFDSEEDSFTDRFETNQYQENSWLEEQITRKLRHLNSLSLIKDSIGIGPFQPSESPPKSDRDVYFEKRTLYLNYMSEARTGSIKYDRPIIAELLAWLRANFKDEYL